MILIDMNQMTIANIMSESKGKPVFNENLIRHMIINNLRILKNKFSFEYGEMVICYDSPLSWRKIKYDFYKKNRKKQREKSEFDWDALYKLMNSIKEELRSFFPYKVLECIGCEADDIIATLCKRYHESEKMLIISGDEDFFQLQKYKNVNQYSGYHKKLVTCPNPSDYLFEHVVRGDASDGIPNILSPDDVFLTEGTRQKSISSKKLEAFKAERILDGYFTPDTIEVQNNLNRNKELIDFEFIPNLYHTAVLNEFSKVIPAKRDKILDYLITKQMKNLIEHLSEF